jgi:hypothetical protein
MGRFRFTIAGLLLGVLAVGAAFAALRAADDTWDSGSFGVTLTVLLISVLLVNHRTGLRRAFWLGFALFGWSYLVLSIMSPTEARLPTTKALAYLDSKVSDRVVGLTFVYSATGAGGSTGKPVQEVAFSVDGSTLTTNGRASLRLWDAVTGRLFAGPNGTSENFVRIGHCSQSILLESTSSRRCSTKWIDFGNDLSPGSWPDAAHAPGLQMTVGQDLGIGTTKSLASHHGRSRPVWFRVENRTVRSGYVPGVRRSFPRVGVVGLVPMAI